MLTKEQIIEEVTLTDNPFEALYILADGSMIWGEFDCGVRGIDHRMIELFVDGADRYESKFWDIVHYELGLVRTVPESMTALIKEGQKLTEEQKRIIENAGYELEVY
jgi:hypothetical protein